jgi:hypothetical protein
MHQQCLIVIGEAFFFLKSYEGDVAVLCSLIAGLSYAA